MHVWVQQSGGAFKFYNRDTLYRLNVIFVPFNCDTVFTKRFEERHLVNILKSASALMEIK
jgi:hypothetical protein